MAKAGDEFVSPIGERLLFRKTSSDTQGELLEVEVFYQPRSSGPPVHYHPIQEEFFQVVTGTIRAVIDGQERTYQAGEQFTIPPSTSHSMYNAGNDVAHLIWQTRPALRTETFFETLWGLAQDGKTNQNGVPNLFQVAILVQEYDQELRLTKPPYAVQRTLFAVLAPVSRLLGYRTRYEKYSGEK